MTGVCALIPAAGRGVRFGSADNKVFAPLLGRPLLGWTLDAFAHADRVEHILLIGGPGDLERLREIGERFGGGKVRDVVLGGTDRQESVLRGVVAGEGAAWLIVHDAARPCVSQSLIEATLDAACGSASGAATAALSVADTMVRGTTVDASCLAFATDDVARENLWAVQTPQAFRADVLRDAHASADRESFRGTDDAGLVRRLGGSVALVPGSPENLKVTRPEDLTLAEAILARREKAVITPEIRIGYGYDVHVLTEGRRLLLGGVEYEDAPRGLLGHSDADVLLHAVCDALLGAAGLGDIGKLFPNTDAAHKDRPSVEFLREVAARLKAEGWAVANVDVTVLAEAPKILPRSDAMRAVISRGLEIAAGQVGIKATTGEGLGFVGRGEGIAAHAVALIRRG